MKKINCSYGCLERTSPTGRTAWRKAQRNLYEKEADELHKSNKIGINFFIMTEK